MSAAPRERWVVISNCQSVGLARSIAAVARSIECDSCDVWQMKDMTDRNPDHFRGYDLALVLPDAHHYPGFPVDALPTMVSLPHFIFGGYHPDCCYIAADGALITEGLIGPYHSMIALAAYKERMGPAEAARWFNDSLYQQAGYYLQWDAQRDGLIDMFREHGFDIRPIFRRISRGRSFMHCMDHPAIETLMALAKVVLQSLDRPCHDNAPPPPDNLAVTSWPVYPEIGERFGVRGGYQFRPRNSYAALGLEAYLEQAFAEFRPWDRSLLRVKKPVQGRLQNIRRLIREGL